MKQRNTRNKKVKQATRKRRGAKERVLARYPSAWCSMVFGEWRIDTRWLTLSAGCRTRQKAWQDAARRINDVSK